MQVYFEYLLKASICQSIIFLFYSLLLKKITWYAWNRYFLLLFSILSFAVPLVNVNIVVPEQHTISFISQVPVIATHPIIVSSANQTGSFDIFLSISIIYLFVSSLLLARLLIQLISIKEIKSKAALIAGDKVKIYHVSEPILPFSFLNNIFINKDNYTENELQDIIRHEQVHAEQSHSFDTLIIEIMCIVNWFNPFAWLMKKAVRENLEFIADDVVIRKGADKKSYQYLLLKVTGDIPLSVTSNLKISSLKSRILMMNKTKTSWFHLFKFVLFVPVIIFLLLAFRSSKQIKPHVKTRKIETYTLSNLTYSIPDEKVKAIVLKEKDKSLLKAGVDLNLKEIFSEKDRLKSLLERHGYNNLKSNAIMFWIDTISVKHSFSIEIKIDAEPPAISSANKIHPLFNSPVTGSDDRINASVSTKANIISIETLAAQKSITHPYLNNGKTAV